MSKLNPTIELYDFLVADVVVPERKLAEFLVGVGEVSKK